MTPAAFLLVDTKNLEVLTCSTLLTQLSWKVFCTHTEATTFKDLVLNESGKWMIMIFMSEVKLLALKKTSEWTQSLRLFCQK